MEVVRRSAGDAAQPSSYASNTMTTLVAAVLVFACVILSSVQEVDAQSTTQDYDAMPRHGRSLLQDEPLKDVACDDKCQKWVRFSLSFSHDTHVPPLQSSGDTHTHIYIYVY